MDAPQINMVNASIINTNSLKKLQYIKAVSDWTWIILTIHHLEEVTFAREDAGCKY